MGVKNIVTLPRSGITLYDYQFDSMLEFLDYIMTKPKVTLSNVSHQFGIAQKIFTGTWTFGKAYKLCEQGFFDKNVKSFQSIYLNMSRQVEKAISYTKTKRDVVGVTPNVPLYLTGNPLNMINIVPKPKKSKPKGINLRFNAAIAWQNSTKIIKTRGLVYCVLYDILDKLNCDVKLYVNDYSYIKNRSIITRNENEDEELNYDNFPKFNLNIAVPLIKKGEMMNISKMYFPLVHPSFLRRLCFAFSERCVELKDRQEFFKNYGKVGHLRNFYQIKNERLNINDRLDIVSDDYDKYLVKGVKYTLNKIMLDLASQGAVLESPENINNLFDSLDFSSIESITYDIPDKKTLVKKGFSDQDVDYILKTESKDKKDNEDSRLL